MVYILDLNQYFIESYIFNLSLPHKLQQEEEEVIRKRAANSTALAAIGPRKKRKLDEILEATSSTSTAVSMLILPTDSRVHCISSKSSTLLHEIFATC